LNFLVLPLKNLRRHRVRSILTALGIAIALAGMLALVGLSRGLERSWAYFLEGKGTHILALQKGSIDALAAALDENLAPLLRSQEGVAAATAGLGEMVDLESGQMVLLAGWPLDSDFWPRLKLVEGKCPGAANPDSVVLGETLARAVGKKTGDTLQLGGHDFRIAGITRQASVLDDRSVMIPMVAMQRLVGREGKASGFHIRVRNPDRPGEVERVRDRLAAAFPKLSFVPTAEVARDTQVLRLLRAIAWSSSTIALGMAFVAVLNTLLMAVIEKTREFGLLCAVGWHSARVMAVVMLDGLLLSAAGSVAGVAMGLLCLRWIAAHPKLGGLFQPEVTAGLVLESVGLALLVGLLGGVYPAWRATRLNPVELLRSE
jgi:putative ABC transport system permease protein